jgi:hypothetical protein
MSDMAKNKSHQGMLDRMEFLKKRDQARQKAQDSARNRDRAKKQQGVQRSLAADVEDQRADLIEAIIHNILEYNQEQRDYRSVVRKRIMKQKAEKKHETGELKSAHEKWKAAKADFKKHSKNHFKD